jgi:hypothetical protein
MTVFGAGFAATSEHFRKSRNPSIVVNRRTRTQSVQNRIVSETHSSRCPEPGSGRLARQFKPAGF